MNRKSFYPWQPPNQVPNPDLSPRSFQSFLHRVAPLAKATPVPVCVLKFKCQACMTSSG